MEKAMFKRLSRMLTHKSEEEIEKEYALHLQYEIIRDMKNNPRCTCNNCDWETNGCSHVWDPYNMDGDCLAMK